MAQYEVLEKSTGARMSHVAVDKLGPSSTTLFETLQAALDWLDRHALHGTHVVAAAK